MLLKSRLYDAYRHDRQFGFIAQAALYKTLTIYNISVRYLRVCHVGTIDIERRLLSTAILEDEQTR